jgi:hypothetical protein
MLVKAARLQTPIAIIAACAAVMGPAVPSVLQASDDDPISCSERITRLDRLGDKLKEVYARPGPPPPGVPPLASPDEGDE